MKLRGIKIQNFRNLVDVDIPIDDTTILIGENNSGKTAFINALKIALPNYVKIHGKYFGEYDYHMSSLNDSPETSDGITIELLFREDKPNEWPDAIIQDLNDICQIDPNLNIYSIHLRLSSKYDKTSKEFVPKWEFLNNNGESFKSGNAAQSNLSKFIQYIRLFSLSPIRDSNDEFSPHSQYWGTILKKPDISKEKGEEIAKGIQELNNNLLNADPKLESLKESLGKVQEIMGFGSKKNTTIHIFPLKPWELMSRSEVAIKANGSEIEFPLTSYGQGTQSLSVLFLFQSYIDLLLKPTFKPETEAILTLEEPEAHLHPQAVRAISINLGEIKSQKIISSHSPYFIQDIPFKNIRVFRRYGSLTKVLYIKRQFIIKIPKCNGILQFCQHQPDGFDYEEGTGSFIIKKKMGKEELESLKKMYQDQEKVKNDLEQLYKESQKFVNDEDLNRLETFAKRVRGEILFARAWLLCEGQTEYLLINYFAKKMGKPLDYFGITVIDFQNNGSPDIFIALAITYDIPWIMITDSDSQGLEFSRKPKDRGFTDEDIKNLVHIIPIENASLEEFLVKNGFFKRFL